MSVPEGEPLPLLWTEQRLPECKSVRRGDFTTGETLVGLTLRISHVPSALAARHYNSATGTLVVQIEDHDLPGNAGPWQVTFEDGVAAVAPAPDESPELACDVSTLASLWSGTMSVSTAWRWGRVQVSDEALLPWLDDAFRTRTAPFMPDYDTF
jgi:predicted acetyltransferase